MNAITKHILDVGEVFFLMNIIMKYIPYHYEIYINLHCLARALNQHITDSLMVELSQF